ncbi:family 43 glycosylhydrolase [Paenibacillus gansuensis]|uniref:Family 43 glycosylhydrolase n=1 Tax=Paenibacillus gansuensis TaxID=306542 RepID=A0ABW5P9N0_9BACL
MMQKKAWFSKIALAALLLAAAGWGGWVFMSHSEQVSHQDSDGKPETASVYQNPVFGPTFADPTILKAGDGYYYAYATQEDWYDGNGTHLVPVIRSKDLAAWEYVRDAFDRKPAWRPDSFGIWAPDISYHKDGKYYLYYSLSEWGNLADPGVGVAVSDRPEGPFKDQGMILDTAGSGVGNSIDPQYVEDDDGKPYLIWGSFHGIYGIPLSEDGLKAVGEKFPIAGPDFEAPYIVKRDGYYYFFGSTGTCCEGENSSYAVAVGRAESLRGPYLDKEGKDLLHSSGSLLLVGSNLWEENGTFAGPGHNSLVTDEQGEDWIVYHAIDIKKPYNDNGGTVRPLMVDRIKWKDGWPEVAGMVPSQTPQALKTKK